MIHGNRFTSGRFLHGLVLALGLGFFALPDATAQDAVAGAATWTSKCSGCHGASPTGARNNASDAPAIISAAIANNAVTGMGGVATTATERSNLGAYIESIFATSPIATSTPYITAKAIGVSGDITLNTAATALTNLVTVTAPAKGTLSYNNTTETITYTPSLGQIGSDSFTYRARNAGSTLFSSTRTVNVTITKANQTLSFGIVFAKTYSPGGTFTVTATATSGLAETYTTLTASVCTVGLTTGTVTIQSAGTCTIAANQAGNTFYNAAPQVTQNITINKANQTISFAAIGSQTYSPGGTFTVNATATSGLAEVYSTLTPGVCTVNSSSGLVAILAAGSCTIAANQSGNINYNAAAQVTQAITINKANQAITFPAQTSPRSYTLGGTFAVSPLATGGGSGNAVTYSSLTTGVCTVAGTTVTMVAAGTCTIAANQAGNTNYNAAPQVTQNVVINGTVPGAPVIGVATAGDTTASIAFSPPANNGGTPITGYTATCTPGPKAGSGGTSPILVTGLTNGQPYSCSVTATNAVGTGAASGSVGVTPAATPVPPVFTSANNTSFTVATFGSFMVTASGVPAPTFSATALPPGLTLAANGTLSGTPSLGSVGNYSVTLTATNSQGSVNQAFSLAVVKANQAISFTPPGDQLFGTTTVPLSATATSGLAVTFASLTPTVCSVSGGAATKIAVGTCTIRASQAGNLNYNAATPVDGSFAIDMGPQTINFPAQVPSTVAYSTGGTFPVSPIATASSGLAVAYSSGTPATCSIAGSTVTILAAGTCTIEANQVGDANYLAAPQVTQDVIIAKGNQTITFPAQAFHDFSPGGTFAINPLATATSGLAVTYNSTTLSICTLSGTTVTMVAVGTCTVSANQAGDSNWNAAASVLRNISIQAVVPGAPTIGLATPGNAQATIEFTPPAFDGGTPITGYIATCNPGAIVGNAAASPVTVSGLVNDTLYSCSVQATNIAGTGPASGTVNVTPVALDGSALWSTTCIACHGATPAGTRFNAAGTTATVLEYVRQNQPSMLLTPAVQALSAADLAAIAQYIATFVPPVDATTATNVPKSIDVFGRIFLNTISFTDIEVVTPPTNGTLSAFTGTTVVYTPNSGFSGADSFTYRGARTSPTALVGDARTATITVSASAPLLSVVTAGGGSGTVTSSPAGAIACTANTGDCSEGYALGETVTLAAAAAPDSNFTGWSGAGCTGTGDCVVTMDGSKSVTATFALQQFTLGVIANGAGTVTSSPAGISCGATCAASFDVGTLVTLSATPSAGNTFSGWSGDCTGTGPCQVTMNAAHSVTATFALVPVTFTLTVSKVGAGTVTSSPAGINCGATCAASFPSGTSVTLTAVPAAGSSFTGWSGACAGTGTCQVTLSAARAVTATFATIQNFQLTVAKSGAGAGTVTSAPAGINCGATCSASFVQSTGVTLTAAPASGSFFAGWSGACTGTGNCSVTMDAARSVTATFKPLTSIPRLGNISTRMQVLTGNDVMIGGFVIGGSTPKTVVVRARGPSLVPFGITNALADPTLQLFSGQTVIASNNDFGTATNLAQLVASGFAPDNAKESAILATLAPGAYTAVVSGVGNTTGVAIVEVFEVDHPEVPLVNISTRGQVLTGNDVMIGGFVIQGDSPQTVVVRARGPSLIPFGITNALQNPVLQLFSGQIPLSTNDDWQTGFNALQLQASGFAPDNALESAILITLNPGAYTAIVTGAGGTTGVAIVEVFAQ